MNENLDIFHIMRTMRPMRRFQSEPVPEAVINKILDAGTWAPNALNTQPYRFLVVRDLESKILFGQHYDKAMSERFASMVPDDDDNSSTARNIRTAMRLGKHLREVPVLLVVCGQRDWPFAVPASERVGLAPPSFGSVYPCVQNILLACRALGLGACLTTLHQLFEEELCKHFGIPDDFGIVAVIPIGYPRGNFGPVGRRPSSVLTYLDRWGSA